MNHGNGSGTAQAVPAGAVSIADAAAECGVSLGTFIGWMVRDGMLLEHPGGGYIDSPHPDLVELPR